jgi:hypothetical protein
LSLSKCVGVCDAVFDAAGHIPIGIIRIRVRAAIFDCDRSR